MHKALIGADEFLLFIHHPKKGKRESYKCGSFPLIMIQGVKKEINPLIYTTFILLQLQDA